MIQDDREQYILERSKGEHDERYRTVSEKELLEEIERLNAEIAKLTELQS